MPQPCRQRGASNTPEDVERVIPYRRRAPLHFISPQHRAAPPGDLPKSLWAVADHLAQRTPQNSAALASSRTAIVSGGMVAQLRPLLRAVRRRHPLADREDALGLLLGIAIVVGRSMRPLATPTGSSWGTARSVVSSLRTIGRFERLTPFQAAQIALDGGVGLCRDYASAVQTLFWLAQREWGVFPHARVVTATGRSDFGHGWGHAWTWLVERDRRQVVALDVTRAVGTIRAGGEDTLLMSALDGAQHNNLSSLLSAVFVALGTPGATASFAQAATSLASEIEPPRRPAGAELAFRLLRQRGLSEEAERRLRDALKRSRFSMVRPDWEAKASSDNATLRMLSWTEHTPKRRAFVDALLR